MQLVAGQPEEAGEHEWLDMSSGEASMDCGKVHVGGRVRSLLGGTITTDATGPTSYEPDPELAGGTGKAKLPDTAA
jgi:hypothetical protein